MIENKKSEMDSHFFGSVGSCNNTFHRIFYIYVRSATNWILDEC